MAGEFEKSVSVPSSTGIDFGWHNWHAKLFMRSSPFTHVLLVYLGFIVVFIFLTVFVHIFFSIVLAGGTLYVLYMVIHTFNNNPQKLTSEEHIETVQQMLLGGDKKSGLHYIEGDVLYQPDTVRRLPKRQKQEASLQSTVMKETSKK